MNRKLDTDKKAKIIEAAYKILGEQGYDKASMKEIAKEAGVAQGLINYYFPSKEELLYELFEEETCRYCAEMDKLSHIPVTPNFVKDAMRLSMNLVDEHPEWHRLRFELFAIALRTPEGMKHVADSFRQGRDQAVKAMDRLPLGPQFDKQSMAAIVVAVLDGLSLQKMSDPEFDAEAAYGTLAHLLEVYMAAVMRE